jgi:hypothetical protein
MKSTIHEYQKNEYVAMSKKIITLAIALMPALFFGQAAFEKYEQDKDFTSVVVNKKSFSMLSHVKNESADKEAKQYQELIGKIELFKVITTEKTDAAADLKASTAKYIKTAGLEELMRVKDKGVDMKIMVKSGATETKITEILMFAEGIEKEHNAVLLLVKGNFDLQEISDLMGKVLPTATDNYVDAKLSEADEALKMKVYPNPASEVFYINTTAAAGVKIFDLSGRLVKSEAYSASGISVSGLAPATYVVEITTGSKRQTEQIVIK